MHPQLDLITVMKRVRKDNPFMSTLELLQAEQAWSEAHLRERFGLKD